MSLGHSIALSRAPLPAFAVVGLFWGALAAQVPVLKAGLGASDGLFGLLILCSASGAVTAMWLAPRIDAVLGRYTMQAAALGVAVAFLFPGLLTNIAAYGVAMFFCGAASGLLDVVMNARVSQIEARTGRGLMNLNHAGFSLAYGLSALAAGAAREAGISPPQVFAGLGVVACLLALPMRLAPDHDGPEGEAPPSGHGFRRVVLLTGVITLLAFMTENATEAWSALHIERTLGGGAAQGALGPALLGLTMCLGRLMGQVVTPRGREGATMAVASVMASAGLVVAALAGGPLTAYAGFALMGLGVSVVAPLAFAAAGRMVRARDRALAISRVSVIGYFGFFIGPPLMGFISEAFGLRASFAAVALLILLVPLLLLPLRASQPGLSKPGPSQP